MKKDIIQGFNNYDLACYFWSEVNKPKAVIQIIHGMQEHALRYDYMAKYFNSLGYIVFASDLRGHGATAAQKNLLGHTNNDIFKEIVSDQIIITQKLKQHFDLPVYVIGHSFGSFITQRYIQVCALIPKVVLCGSAYTKTLTNYVGKFIADFTAIFKGNHAEAKLIEQMSFGNYKKHFENGNWLCSDEKIFTEYNSDPLCGTPFPVCFYKSMLKNLIKNYRDLNTITPEQKILIVSGDQDPVGNYGKSVKKLYDVYFKKNIKAELKIYSGGRHEILNETNKTEIFDDIINFLEKK